MSEWNLDREIDIHHINILATLRKAFVEKNFCLHRIII